MWRWRVLHAVLLTVLFSGISFGADIDFSPSPPELGKDLTITLKGENLTEIKWDVKRKQNGVVDCLQSSPPGAAQTKLSALSFGEYVIAVSYKEASVEQTSLEIFAVTSAADAKLNESAITKESVSLYLKAKIPGDTDSPLTALMMADKLKEVLRNNQDVTDASLIYQDLRAGAKEVVDKRLTDIKRIFPADYGNDAVSRKMLNEIKARFTPWIDATEKLIARLQATTTTASELRIALNEAVLPALGAESIPLSEREPETPVPPLNADTLFRILQQHRGTTTTVPASRRHRRCCIGYLLRP
jgi:hypothetical protein